MASSPFSEDFLQTIVEVHWGAADILALRVDWTTEVHVNSAAPGFNPPPYPPPRIQIPLPGGSGIATGVIGTQIPQPKVPPDGDARNSYVWCYKPIAETTITVTTGVPQIVVDFRIDANLITFQHGWQPVSTITGVLEYFVDYGARTATLTAPSSGGGPIPFSEFDSQFGSQNYTFANGTPISHIVVATDTETKTKNAALVFVDLAKAKRLLKKSPGLTAKVDFAAGPREQLVAWESRFITYKKLKEVLADDDNLIVQVNPEAILVQEKINTGGGGTESGNTKRTIITGNINFKTLAINTSSSNPAPPPGPPPP
jgi:hypothetical protein